MNDLSQPQRFDDLGQPAEPAEHGLAAKIEVIGVGEADAAYDRVVAGDVHFRAVIDTATRTACCSSY